ncbi:envelope stress response protein PspG [Thaumasiovibrio subtropicus]|uniref:envelope stress response protein PspG n=1 Tax=Thaumasiovibrio subtropicus TaxID=1891207 RepID=UPI000B3604A9|nr:envelope stress response protein PspG [Thaumasiovibrio subtropicus]
MVEFLFVLGFAGVLFVTGISLVGLLIALAVGFFVMALAGMIGVVFKLLPWLLAVWLVVWLVRQRNPQPSMYYGRYRCRNRYRR